MATSTQRTTLERQAALDALYAFDQPEEIRPFLARRTHLIDLLLEARAPIEHWFGPEAIIRLTLSVDPDSSSEEGDILYGIIHSSLGLDDALMALDGFTWEWWLDRVPRAEGGLGFDIDL